ncbi:deoxyribodipyrimidine photolyase [Methanoplanus sp. FWC-SCC4]|uniref:Deoxyribodipyrimidine photo-lyase n=1 Tax=Methanochimaera problematica TaxID=2609417 RepID=A0AA97FCP3_9EURY|nr:deoxyribodipyrimidine photo-lyase [Methanoplanus sp. FWC-SCC4]WOF15799.1 deoxyribodipyrimidine photolyase [Methanoplanus sp. FWC-SCC4]
MIYAGDEVEFENRITLLNDRTVKSGDYVLYWMNASVRSEYNHALEYSALTANKMNLPLVVYFGIYRNFPESNLRHFQFMLEGLKETAKELKNRGCFVYFSCESPPHGAIRLSKKAAVMIADYGYLSIHKEWYDETAKKSQCPVILAESNVVVPVSKASFKEEWSAATIRRKISPQISQYLLKPKKENPKRDNLKINIPKMYFDQIDIKEILNSQSPDGSVPPSPFFKGGYLEAKKHLDVFIKKKLAGYNDFRNNPEYDCLSNMSPYLHFGHISPVEIAIEVVNSGYLDYHDYLEQLIVRRELAVNFVSYNPDYNNFNCLPEWCKKTLLEHRFDIREYLYTPEDFERSKTHDKYWNASNDELKISGKMHGYMRMYWGKKILEWSKNPIEAFETALYLNNKYSLDGRDPNSYAGIAWCFGKHDRAWMERPVFGKIRYMNENGLKRKFNPDLYVEKVSGLSYGKNLS